jgi:glycosyltransferase involved in cell wall biosynthesis
LVGDDLLGIDSVRTPTYRPLALVYAGGIAFEKGPDLLVRAAERLAFPVTVDIIGTGKDFAALRDLARSAKIPVTVHGEVDRTELCRLLSQADLAINPQRMTDQMRGQIFPFKMIEYLGAGLPVVTSRLGELPLGTQDALVTYEKNTPEGLAEGITRARDRLSTLSAAATRVRVWVREEYSSVGASAKCEGVFRIAIERGLRRSRKRQAVS